MDYSIIKHGILEVAPDVSLDDWITLATGSGATEKEAFDMAIFLLNDMGVPQVNEIVEPELSYEPAGPGSFWYLSIKVNYTEG